MGREGKGRRKGEVSEHSEGGMEEKIHMNDAVTNLIDLSAPRKHTGIHTASPAFTPFTGTWQR